MRKLFLPAVACTLWLMFTGSAAAATIDYPVNLMVGAAGSIVGDITTDGRIGTLHNGDIVSFSLTLDSPNSTTAPETLASNSGGSVFIGPGGLAASATALTFDFNNSGSFLNFFSPNSADGCSPIWTLRSGGGTTCNGITGTVDAIGFSDGFVETTPGSDNPIIAGQEAPPTVPEPAGLAMIVVGLVSMIGLRKLRF